MFPSQLKPGQFKDYPPQARRFATEHLDLLRQLPLAFAPLLLQQIQEYDWKFPAERREIEGQVSYLGSLSAADREQVLEAFDRVKLSGEIERYDWVNWPGGFSEKLSAELWATHQIDAFRQAATKYMEKFTATLTPEKLPASRLGVAVVGKGVERNAYPLFRKLRPHGTHFTNVDPANGLQVLIEAAAARATAHPMPYAHWYLDGGESGALPKSPMIPVSYGGLAPVREALLKKIHDAIRGGIGGPEALRTMLHRMRPEEIGLSGSAADEVVSHFQASILTSGSGTQIFSTTFVQWTSRELWRRAQPLTILARFAPRQRQRPMNEMLSAQDQNPEVDPAGSLIDADMGSYYIWIDQQRLSEAEKASFLVWFEDHREALVISPYLPRNARSENPVDMKGLLAQMEAIQPPGGKSSRQSSANSPTLRPTRDNYVLDGVDGNVNTVDFLNGADYNGPA